MNYLNINQSICPKKADRSENDKGIKSHILNLKRTQILSMNYLIINPQFIGSKKHTAKVTSY